MNKIIQGEALEVLKTLDEESVDTLITDPPAGISFMGKKWDSDKGGRDEWIAWLQEVMEECHRVLKPGAMALVWALPRTSHWTATAVENAGFEVRDIIMHIFGSGFPKSLNIGKAIDKMQGNERDIIGYDKNTAPDLRDVGEQSKKAIGIDKLSFGQTSNVKRKEISITKGNSGWDGWGTALKPAAEHWILAMKPIDKNFANNALVHGVAGLNIDAGRIGTEDNSDGGAYSKGDYLTDEAVYKLGTKRLQGEYKQPQGRFPANIILDEEAGKVLDEQQDNASRFFYQAKPSKAERNMGLEGFEEKRGGSMDANTTDKMQLGGASLKGEHKELQATRNNHPTVKSLSLMRYLIRLTSTPTGGIVLDPFAGSGTTGMAAKMERRDFIGIELDGEYVKIAEARIKAIQIPML